MATRATAWRCSDAPASDVVGHCFARSRRSVIARVWFDVFGLHSAVCVCSQRKSSLSSPIRSPGYQAKVQGSAPPVLDCHSHSARTWHADECRISLHPRLGACRALCMGPHFDACRALCMCLSCWLHPTNATLRMHTRITFPRHASCCLRGLSFPSAVLPGHVPACACPLDPLVRGDLKQRRNSQSKQAAYAAAQAAKAKEPRAPVDILKVYNRYQGRRTQRIRRDRSWRHPRCAMLAGCA